MRITVFGANGRVGSLVVEELVRRGHEVTAFVHGSSQLGAQDTVRVVQGDIYEESDVSEALGSADAAVSALGSWGTKNKDILTQGMRHIVPIMEAMGVRRIVSLTGADADAPGDTSSTLHALSRRLLGAFARKVLQDGEQHIMILSGSSLDWTVLRSPIMTKKDRHSYQLNSSRPMPWARIERSAVVVAMCDLVESENHIASAPFIHRA